MVAAGELRAQLSCPTHGGLPGGSRRCAVARFSSEADIRSPRLTLHRCTGGSVLHRQQCRLASAEYLNTRRALNLASYPFVQPGHKLHAVWQAFSSAVRAEEARLHAACRADTTLEQIREQVASLVRTAEQSCAADAFAAQQPALHAEGSAKSVLHAEGGGLADLQLTLKRGFESVDRGLAAVVEAVQDSKRPHLDIITPYQPDTPPVMKLHMPEVQDRALFVPFLEEHTVHSVWKVFVEKPRPRVPNPSAFMRSTQDRKCWFKYLDEKRLKRRGQVLYESLG